MTRPVRVLLLSDRLDIAGGLERFVCSLANHLATEGMLVMVGSVDTPRARIVFPLDASVQVMHGEAEPADSDLPADAAGALRAWRIFKAQWRIGRALARVVREVDPDVVVLNGLTTACSTLLFGLRFAPRAICCDHNHFTARSRPWQRLRQWLYPKAGAVVSLTAADAAKFRELNANTHVIYNASALHADSPALPKEPLALAVGRHAAQKGFDLLVAAWAQVLKSLPQARLRVLGDGPLRAEHESLAQRLGLSGSIEWLPPTDQIGRHYREAAVFVLSSRYEGMPLALLEAQALGVPAVAFDCPTGPAEIVTPQTGRLVDAGDVDGLARALVELLASPSLRERMGFAAIERSVEVFNPQRHERQWAALVRDVAVRNAYGAAT